jgi:uncharacterized protein
VTSSELNYNQLVETALMGVVRQSLRHASEYGLSGQQHFYVTFKTKYDGVQIPAHLHERYKDEMTIVLQHQFWELLIEDDYFSVGLSFNHQKEILVIPFDAITAFADPSVQFGLQFDFNGDGIIDAQEDDDLLATEAEPQTADAENGSANEAKQGEVIALDAFRNK